MVLKINGNAEQVLEDFLASAEGQKAAKELEGFVVKQYALQIEKEWGVRCSDFEPECPVCQAWAKFDKWKGND